MILSDLRQDGDLEERPVFKGLRETQGEFAYPQKVVTAVFMRNHLGEVCITISDASFLGTEYLSIEADSGDVHAFYDDKMTFLSDVSGGTIKAMKKNGFAHLRAMRVDGTIGEVKIRVKEKQ